MYQNKVLCRSYWNLPKVFSLTPRRDNLKSSQLDVLVSYRDSSIHYLVSLQRLFYLGSARVNLSKDNGVFLSSRGDDSLPNDMQAEEVDDPCNCKPF